MNSQRIKGTMYKKNRRFLDIFIYFYAFFIGCMFSFDFNDELPLFSMPHLSCAFGKEVKNGAVDASDADSGGNSEADAEANATDEVIKPVSPFHGAARGERRYVSLSFDNMDIIPVLDEILGDILEFNYVIDPAIKGTISVRIRGNYSKDELLELLNNVLDMSGLSITKARHDLYKVVRKANSGRATNLVSLGGKRGLVPGDQIAILQLTYISASQAVNSVRSFVSSSAVIFPENITNSIIIADTKEVIEKILNIISLIDIAPFKDVEWRIFEAKNREAKDIASDLNKIFKSPGIYSRSGLNKGGMYILPLNSVNSVLVLTRWPSFMPVVEGWFRQLDVAEEEKEPQVYVYFVQNGSAKDLVSVLNQLYGGGSSGSRRGKVLVRRTKKAKNISGKLMGEIEIISDDVNNAIIIKATPRDYETIARVLKEIDIVPRQVLIEVLIAEISLTKDTSYGIEWYIKNKGIMLDGKGYEGVITLSNGQSVSIDTALGETLAGFTYGIFREAGDLRGLLTAISSVSNVNILSSPTILSVDNQESSIEVGDDVPTLTSTQTTSGGVTTQSVQYRNAGIILRVKPYINDRGLVRLEVTQEVSSVASESTGGITSPRFRTRKATTTLIAEDGQTIVIGGLMQNQKTKTKNGVPLLKDMPVLGKLFGSDRFEEEKTELLIAITPHVIQSRKEADDITMEFQDRVKELKKMLEENR